MEYRIAQFVNSFIDRPGNIGVRTGYILRELARQKLHATSFCRGSQTQVEQMKYVTMGWMGHVPRLMNAARIYMFKSWDHRPADIRLFQMFSMKNLDIVREEGIKVAHVWDSCPDLINALKKEGVKVILDVPVVPLSYGRRLQEEKGISFFCGSDEMVNLEKGAQEAADCILAPSSFVFDELVSSGFPENKIRVIEFGASVEARVPRWKEAPDFNSTSGVDFCFLGNVNRRKGIVELLKAWRNGPFSGDRLHLCGRLFPEVKRDLEECAKVKDVVTPGFVDSESYLNRCDVFVFPSWLEGSSKAVYEAMAHGLPVITTKSSGSIIRDGVDGFIIEAGDVNALMEKMAWFKENPSEIERMGRSARERVSGYTWENYGRRVVALYREYMSL